jgi:hypothetical protein
MELDSTLEKIAILNDGVNHVSEYAIYRLKESDSIDDSIAAYFASLYTSSTSPKTAESWHIRCKLIPEWKNTVGGVFLDWFFRQAFSPNFKAAEEKAYISTCIDLIEAKMGEGKVEVYEVFVDPPMWYDCIWQDFIFKSCNGTWLLHLGFSD